MKARIRGYLEKRLGLERLEEITISSIPLSEKGERGDSMKGGEKR